VTLLAIIASMAGCTDVSPPPPFPVPQPAGLTRCDPGREGWAPDGSFWFELQHGLQPQRITGQEHPQTYSSLLNWSISSP
jgi:hypothetical protein